MLLFSPIVSLAPIWPQIVGLSAGGETTFIWSATAAAGVGLNGDYQLGTGRSGRDLAGSDLRV